MIVWRLPKLKKWVPLSLRDLRIFIQEVATITISSFTNLNCYGTVDQGQVYGGFHAILMNLAYEIKEERIVLKPYSGETN